MQNDNVYTVIFMFKEYNFTNSAMLNMCLSYVIS